MDPIQVFNQLALHGGSRISNGRPFSILFQTHKKIFEDINQKLFFKDSDTVLDMGGGTGEIAKYVSQYCDHLTLADGASVAIRKAQLKLKKYDNISFVLADMRAELPFPREQFDKIICYSVIHYLSNYQELETFVIRLLSCLKPDGLLLIGDIPLIEKKELYLSQRKKQGGKHFVMNIRYYLQKYITEKIYRQYGITHSNTYQFIQLTQESIEKMLNALENRNFSFKFLEQNKRLELAHTRIDLLLTKTKIKNTNSKTYL